MFNTIANWRIERGTLLIPNVYGNYHKKKLGKIVYQCN
jgi:hypothetical protein